MRPLDSFGISAWSWLNALGCLDHTGFDHTDPDRSGTFDWKLSASGLSCHDSSLGLPGKWGRVALPLRPLPPHLVRHESRCARLLVTGLVPMGTAIDTAIERYGPRRVGLVLGSSTGGIDATEAALAEERRTGALPDSYVFEDAHLYHALLNVVRGLHRIEGPGYVISTACSSGGKAIAAAQRMLHAGEVDAVLTGGVDALCEITLRGFGGLGILSDDGCRPFDATRAGISIGEGAALLLLERHTSSELSVLGVGESSDAHHVTAPHPLGLGARLAMERALSMSRLEPSDVRYVNAHGTGTRQNDASESRAIFDLCGVTAPFSSTKDRIGHQLGAAGATEALFCVHALEAQRIPLNRPPDEIDSELALQPRVESDRCSEPLLDVLSNSFAFGGSNVTVALGLRTPAAEELPVAEPASTSLARRARVRERSRRGGDAYVRGIALWGEGYCSLEAFLAGTPDSGCAIPPAEMLERRPRGRASVLTRLFAELYGQLRGPADSPNFDPTTIATIYGSAYGEMGTTMQLLDQLKEDPTLSPVRFQASVHNTAGGQLSIATANQSFSTAIAAGPATVAMTLFDGLTWLGSHGGEALVLMADEAGPTRLLRGKSFPPLGIGLHLAWASEPPKGSLARLGEMVRSDTQPNGGTPSAAGPFERAPAVQSLDLMLALANGTRGEVAMGDGWALELHHP